MHQWLLQWPDILMGIILSCHLYSITANTLVILSLWSLQDCILNVQQCSMASYIRWLKLWHSFGFNTYRINRHFFGSFIELDCNILCTYKDNLGKDVLFSSWMKQIRPWWKSWYPWYVDCFGRESHFSNFGYLNLSCIFMKWHCYFSHITHLLHLPFQQGYLSHINGVLMRAWNWMRLFKSWKRNNIVVVCCQKWFKIFKS